MEEIINVNKFVSKEQYKHIFDIFSSYHGYMTKLVNKANNELSGYLIRAEISIDDIIFDDSIPSINLIDKLETKYVAITFVPYVNKKHSPNFLKSVGINRVLVAGTRKLKNIIKNNKPLVNDSILNYFNKPTELSKDYLKLFESEHFNYEQFYHYIEMFENKIKNYYKDKNVIILVV